MYGSVRMSNIVKNPFDSDRSMKSSIFTRKRTRSITGIDARAIQRRDSEIKAMKVLREILFHPTSRTFGKEERKALV